MVDIVKLYVEYKIKVAKIKHNRESVKLSVECYRREQIKASPQMKTDQFELELLYNKNYQELLKSMQRMTGEISTLEEVLNDLDGVILKMGTNTP